MLPAPYQLPAALVLLLGGVVSCFFGYRARGGPADVGRAVAKSIVVNLVLVHVIASLYLGLFYGQDLQLPIGG